ncbi:MAG: hypothetical protein U0792_13600 [Gemmataceae bacterium]
MGERESKLKRANVVAGFDTQDEADGAVYELRATGYRDRRIGYFYPAPNGKLVDLLARHHRIAGCILWGIVGAIVGAWGGLFVAAMWYPPGESPDVAGMVEICSICGALFLGMAGGLMGLGTEWPGETVPAPMGPLPPYVMAVDAGNHQREVWDVLHRRGGYEFHPIARMA